MRSRLAPVGILAEPEGHYADDKRADIKILAESFSIPVEIKRHYHPDLWVAPRQQLQNRYSRDPGSHGHGIYLVLWFGYDVDGVPNPPPGIARPSSATELKTALYAVLREEDRPLIEVVVLDCAPSKPSAKVAP